MFLQTWLRRLVPLIGVLGIFLPALTASLPLLPSHEWSAVQIGTAAVKASAPGHDAANQDRPSLASILRQASDMRKELSQVTGQGGNIPVAFKLALMIPVAVLLAAMCSLLVLLGSWLRWGMTVTVTASLGILCSGYTLIASWLLTRTLQEEVQQAIDRTQQSLSFLHIDPSSFSHSVGMSAGVGVYLMLLAFLIMVVLPAAMVNEG